MSIAEELLLAYRPDTGRTNISHLPLGLVGATLIDLARARRLDLSGKDLIATSGSLS